MPAPLRRYLRGELAEAERLEADRREIAVAIDRARRAAQAPRGRVARVRGGPTVPPPATGGVAGDLGAALAMLPDRRSIARR